MKLMRSIRRELVLLSRSIYFYVEIAVALIFLALLLVVLPENFDTRATEYTYFDVPAERVPVIEEALITGLGPYTAEDVTLYARGKTVPARFYTTDVKYLYVVDTLTDLIALAEDTGKTATVVHAPEDSPAYEFYLQGNETERFKEYSALMLSGDFAALLRAMDQQPVRFLEPNPRALTDRQSVLPMMLTVNCVLMGILVTAAYIVEDKNTRVIKALRALPARMETYLAAKMAAVLLTALLTCLAITVPVMRTGANYFLLILTIVCGGFLTVSGGALIASFFDDMAKAFSSVFLVLIVLLVPAVLNLIPTADAPWLRLVPSHFVLESIKEALLNRSPGYVLMSCAGFTAGGLALLMLSARRYKAAGMGG